MRTLLILTCASAAALAQTPPHPTGPRITPPVVNVVAPKGIARGTTTEITVEGLNLAKASAIHFSRPGVTGRIIRVKELPDLPDIRLGSNGTPSTVDVGPLPPRNQVTVEVDVSPEAEIGPIAFRLENYLGTSPEGRLLIEPYYGESPDREPNDTLENAFETYLPTILVGEISRPGDIDYYKIKVKAGEEIIFENSAALAGSSLQPVVSIVGEDLAVVREVTKEHFAHRFDKDGTYYIKVADALQSGRTGHFYRIKAGNFPFATHAFPLGVQQGKTAEVTLAGYDLGNGKTTVKGELTPDSEDSIRVRPDTTDGLSFSELRLAVGRDPEVTANGANTSLASAEPVTLPVTINGRIKGPQYFRLHLAKGQKTVFEVNARRLGSELDSAIEVLDSAGKPVEIATARAVQETTTALRDHGSADRGVRFNSTSNLMVGDYVMIGSEIMRVESLPPSPDADVIMEAFGGQRLAFFGTTPEAHALDSPIYKVQMHPPGKQFAPNGLPVTRFYAVNDDGGPGFGKDSYLQFIAPADGDYIVRIRDVRGGSGDEFAYRLNIRAPRPDFRLSVNPENPNVPLGGAIPVTVTDLRLDGFTGPIDVKIEDLPTGLRASEAKIAPGQNSTVLLLSADENAKLERAAPLKVAGRAASAVHYADPEDKLKLIALMPKADIVMTAETREVTIEPGGTAQIKVSIARQNGFGGRVPVQVRNLPPRVAISDFGLNGVLITEDERERTFTIEALATAEPMDQLIYVSGFIETRANMQSAYAAPQPILLRIKPKNQVASR